MEKLTMALSIRQPYGELILRGEKDREFRSRPTTFIGRCYIYTPLTYYTDTPEFGEDAGHLTVGHLIGSIYITGFWSTDDGYAWGLSKPTRYETPIKPKGHPQPGFWKPLLP
jgi:predicted transcriptional regulator